MVNYVLLCKDELNAISYYFNMDDGYIYLDNVRVKDESAKAGANYGSMLIFLVYPFIGILGLWVPSVVMGLVAAILGIFAATIFAYIANGKSTLFFSEDKRQETTKEKILFYYKQGEAFRWKCLFVEVGMLLFAIGLSLFIMIFEFSFFFFFCAVVIWAVWGILLCGKRPLCNRKFKKMFNL